MSCFVTEHAHPCKTCQNMQNDAKHVMFVTKHVQTCQNMHVLIQNMHKTYNTKHVKKHACL